MEEYMVYNEYLLYTVAGHVLTLLQVGERSREYHDDQSQCPSRPVRVVTEPRRASIRCRGILGE
jgi:hypothetical protein